MWFTCAYDELHPYFVVWMFLFYQINLTTQHVKGGTA